MSDVVRITDVAPRDGLQNEAGVVAARDKARLIELLAASAVDEVEATSFVSPRWIPQLGDAEEVLGLVHDSLPGWPHRPILSALVPNERGFERALALHSDAAPLKLAVFAAASETFNKKNTNATIAGSVERFGAFLPRAFARGMRVRFYVSCAVACPYEGPIAPAAVRRVVDLLAPLAPAEAWSGAGAEIDLGDTIGVAEPDDISALLDEFDGVERARLTLHLHDTRGRAAACVERAIGRGVRSFDASAGGLGGCPFAGTPQKPAPGNIATASLLDAIERTGLRHRVDRAKLDEASAFARRIVASARQEAGA